MGFIADKGIKAVCFDIDGTFYPKWQTNLYLTKSALPHLSFSLKYNSMRQKMRKADGYEAQRVLSLDEFREKEMRLMNYRGSKAEYLEKYSRILAEPWKRNMKRIKCFPCVKEGLEALKISGLVLGALSDFPLADKLNILGLEGLFDFEASTEDFGYLKPNITPFLAFLERFGFKAEEVLYVGDSYRKDVMGAKKAGLYAMLIKKSAKREHYPLADFVLTSWNSFAKILL